jgi:transcriptional regulator with XRE-family HTH domain
VKREINKPLKLLIIGKFGLQVDAAEKLGIDVSALSQIIRNRREPSDEQLKKFRRVFGAEAIEKIFPAKPVKNRGTGDEAAHTGA